jgi:spore germination cell wall hydrolase CwlJ-like protein
MFLFGGIDMTRSLTLVLLVALFFVLQQLHQFGQTLTVRTHATMEPVFEQVKPVKLSKKELDCLARNVFYEAGTEEPVGKIAVAQTTLNRVKTGYWGHNICDVVYAPKQFSWTGDSRAYEEPKGHLWTETKLAVSSVIDNGLRIKQLKTALFYHADYVDPKWKDNDKRVAQYGTHIFYSGGKDSWLAVNL